MVAPLQAHSAARTCSRQPNQYSPFDVLMLVVRATIANKTPAGSRFESQYGVTVTPSGNICEAVKTTHGSGLRPTSSSNHDIDL